MLRSEHKKRSGA